MHLDPSTQTKPCSACRAVLPASSFYKNAAMKDGLGNQCKRCQNDASFKWRRENDEAFRNRVNARNRKWRYNITPEQYDAMLAEQGGVCAVCGQAETDRDPSGRVKPLCVDHDHACPCDAGRSREEKTRNFRLCGSCIRGLLCQSCNRSLGAAKDNPATLRALADYVEERRATT